MSLTAVSFIPRTGEASLKVVFRPYTVDGMLWLNGEKGVRPCES
jgi:hypothetical protein